MKLLNLNEEQKKQLLKDELFTYNKWKQDWSPNAWRIVEVLLELDKRITALEDTK